MIDLHTHLYPEKDSRYLSGLVELLNYHYFLGEYALYNGLRKNKINSFLNLSKIERANKIWDDLFFKRDHKLFSEQVKGVITILKSFGIFYPTGLSFEQILEKYPTLSFKEILDKSEVDKVVATYSPDETNIIHDERIIPSVRLNNFTDLKKCLTSDLFKNDEVLYYSWSGESHYSVYQDIEQVNTKIKSGTDYKFKQLANSGIPLWIMLGVRRDVTPYMNLGGDGIGNCDIQHLVEFANLNPELKIPFSILDSTQIHNAFVASRTTPNLYFAGHWWFNNIETSIKQTMNLGIDLIGGDNFIHYYSDARVAEQLIYKWKHFKKYTINENIYNSDGRLRKKIFGLR